MINEALHEASESMADTLLQMRKLTTIAICEKCARWQVAQVKPITGADYIERTGKALASMADNDERARILTYLSEQGWCVDGGNEVCPRCRGN